MTSRLDMLAERGHMIADGRLPESFGEVLDVLRGVRMLSGLGRLRVGAKTLATRIGLTDGALSPGDMRVRSKAPIGDSLIFSVHRPRRRRRPDAPVALRALRHPL